MAQIGRKVWAIPEGYIPGDSVSQDPALISHETACLLNASGNDAHVEGTLYFVDREPVGPYRVTVPARRTLHLRFNDLSEPARVPRDTSYASVIESDTPIVVQHTRLNATRDGKCDQQHRIAERVFIGAGRGARVQFAADHASGVPG